MPKRRLVTADQACIDYAIAHQEVAKLSRELGDPEYAECAKRDQDTGDCLDRLFSCPVGPSGEMPRYPEFFEALCSRCKTRLSTLDQRKAARSKLGAAKRTILKVGNRLSADRQGRQP